MPVDPSPFYPDSQTTPKNQHAECGWYCHFDDASAPGVLSRRMGPSIARRNSGGFEKWLRENPPENMVFEGRNPAQFPQNQSSASIRGTKFRPLGRSTRFVPEIQKFSIGPRFLTDRFSTIFAGVRFFQTLPRDKADGGFNKLLPSTCAFQNSNDIMPTSSPMNMS